MRAIKKLLVLAAMFIMLIGLSITSYAAESISSRAFTYTDARDGKTYTLNPQSGKPAVYVICNETSCSNCKSYISDISSILGDMPSGTLDVWVVYNADLSAVKSVLDGAGAHSAVRATSAVGNSSAISFNSEIRSMKSRFGVTNNSTPTVAYKDSSNKIVAMSGGYVGKDAIISSLKKLGVICDHNYQITSKSGKNISVKCSRCNLSKSLTSYDDIDLWWSTDGRTFYSALMQERFAVGASLSFLARPTGGNGDSFIVEISDGSVATFDNGTTTTSSSMASIKFLKEGMITVTARSIYNSSIKNTYEILVGNYQRPIPTKDPNFVPGQSFEPEGIYSAIVSLKGQYPEGMPWTDDNFYSWKGGIYSGGSGCAGFAFLCSDAAFGSLPARRITSFSIKDVRVGDILRINNNSHSVIVLEVYDDYVIVAEGNYNSSIHWGRKLSSSIVNNATYLMTRYPEGATVPTKAPTPTPGTNPTPTPGANPTPTKTPAPGETSQNAAVRSFVSRLYSIVLGREADDAGLNDWSKKLVDKEKTGSEVALGFFMSQEMINRNLSDEDYVKICYRTMLNREADEGGLANWVAKLENGISREAVLYGFSNSTEFDNICSQYGIIRGTLSSKQNRDQNEGITAFAARCYTKALGRKFDVDGLNDWTGQILAADNKKQKAEKVASDGFFHSQEFANKNTSNGEYVEILYRTFLGREYDEAGYNDWVGKLDSGVSRDEVLYGFSRSAEFNNIMAEYGL